MAGAETSADVAVVGAGPAGLYAAYCAGFRGLSSVIVDALPEPGGQIAALYPEKKIYDIAGHTAVRGRELVDNLVAQVAPFLPRYLLGRTVTSLTSDKSAAPGKDWVIRLEDGTRIRTGAVVVAAGLGRSVPRTLPCLGPYQGRGVAHHVPRLDEHRDRDVVIVGGGDSAVDWALALTPIARSVTVVHRRSAFRAHEHGVKQMYASGIRVMTDARVTACHGAENLEEVRVRTGEEEWNLPAQSLVAALGFITNLGPIADWGLRMENRRILVDTAMRTNLPGIYAVGDICSYEGRVPLISVGFGEAATAANHVAVALRPGSRLAPEHSTGIDPTPLS
ncbi:MULTISPECIES: NAD(P)/FAD-dependent oxidoreductase [unclassified Streptomyces]|uniref:NAD(P)/FAD-dependent oxidoreductase n=1 Tax=unclassified Streptomyces TaxID=2593676 RepID=UPI0016617C6E|nr:MULTISPECIES: NAD(P)/FAD-dependent oxidoreductase [unclassified Streptomyces]MBD0711491.1 ferredoxin--NADP(+) reductase [Streptomyces sp. CBMA291]MBD0716026.1 ferredoxin--NADP(+) reductase [Streptomyces sp. CBMA370]